MDNKIPVLVPVVDPNEGDTLILIDDIKQSNDELGKFRIVNDGQAIAVSVPKSADKLKSTQITVIVSDGGSDASGICRTPITYTIEEHPYSICQIRHLCTSGQALGQEPI